MKDEHWLEAEENLCVCCTFKGLAGGVVHLQNKVLDRGFAPNFETNPFRQLQLWRISRPSIYHLQQKMSSSWCKVYDRHCGALRTSAKP
jgi:hypothetical protein